MQYQAWINTRPTAKSRHLVKKLLKCLAKILPQEKVNLVVEKTKGRDYKWRDYNVASSKAAGNSSL